MALPAPYIAQPSWHLDGNDGLWSTFALEAGTPPQAFRVLPSTSSSEIRLTVPEGCEGPLSGLSDCGDLRGVQDSSSRGFVTSSSTTWTTIGIYELHAAADWFGDGINALYGMDTVIIESTTERNQTSFQAQTIAGVASTDYWLGSVGLGIESAEFSTKAESIPSLLTSMKRANAIPSLSFGYTAGAYYSSGQTTGSLVLGGYDQARFQASNVNFPMDSNENLALLARVHSMIGTNTLNGTLALQQNVDPVTYRIDSSVTDLWLSQEACNVFAEAFGLWLDATTSLYRLNESIHGQLLAANPSVTFQIGPANDTNSTTNIIMPYSAFVLNVSVPLYNTSTMYFPIRVAADDSQYTLGRTFLQEAYLHVDWERRNFTIGQAIHQNETTKIVPVLPLEAEKQGSGSKALSTGAIIGIAVACGSLAIAAVIVFIFLRKRRRAKETEEIYIPSANVDEKSPKLDSPDVQLSEPMSTPIHELQEGAVKYELMASSLVELQGDGVKQHELEDQTLVTSDKKGSAVLTASKEGSVHELP